ncbi:RGS domain-containing protein [Umbelopsis sp. PMI_123]|nr:RGS domain-containing protein [Umbelopsis sp. PMI_123]
MPVHEDMIMPSPCRHTPSNQLTLELVLSNQTSHPFSLQDFAEYLRQTYCVENLAFWSSVVRYRQCAIVFFTIDPNAQQCALEAGNPMDCSISLETLNSAVRLASGMPFRYTVAEEHYLSAEESIRCGLLKQKFTYIIDTYLSPNSPQEINIHCEMRQAILEQWQTHGCYHPAIFNSARNSILELMRVNSFIPWVSSIKQSLPQHPLDDSPPTRSSGLFLLRKSARSSNSSIGSEEEEDIDDDGSTDRSPHYSTSAFFKRFTSTPWKTKEQKDNSHVDTQETDKPSKGSPHLYNALLPRRPLSSPATSKSSSSSTENVNVSESRSWTWRKGSTKG